MGLLIYANFTPGVEIDDRPLTHLKVVIQAKLRRHESFGFSWNNGVGLGGGRSSVWLDTAIPLRFVFFGSKPLQLNRTWLAELAISANSPAGLYLLPEPTDTWRGDEH